MNTTKGMSNSKPRILWILMHPGVDGWMPSMDHFCAWKTRRAAMRKVSELAARGLTYKPFKYVPGGKTCG